MKSRRRILLRCARCRMHMPLCMCAVLPRLDTTVRVVLVVHAKEWRRVSNTGRLAVLTLRQSELFVYGRRGQAFDPSPLFRPGAQHLLLHPGGDPEPLSAEMCDESASRPVRLLVPDGTWRQSSRIARRLAALPDIRRVRVDPGPSHGLRRCPSTERVGTAAALAEALDVLGGQEAAAGLRDALATLVDRTRWSRGQLAPERVRGGVPLEVRRAMR